MQKYIFNKVLIIVALLCLCFYGGNVYAAKHKVLRYLPGWEQYLLVHNPGLSRKVIDLAIDAHDCAVKSGLKVDKQYLTIIDFSLPSNRKRMWVIDVAKRQVLYYLYVSHGRGSGYIRSQHFSDRPGSKTSSLGLFLTTGTYTGHHGYSLRLQGLEPGFNRHARERLIVIHGANYASSWFVRRYGRLGRSWGCPAINPRYVHGVIDHIKRGSLVFAYYPESKWLSQSRYLHCGVYAKQKSRSSRAG